MKRLENESYEEYRERRIKAQKALKIYLKGRVVWPSKILGTLVYRKEK
jgi:hypothetical protein